MIDYCFIEDFDKEYLKKQQEECQQRINELNVKILESFSSFIDSQQKYDKAVYDFCKNAEKNINLNFETIEKMRKIF